MGPREGRRSPSVPPREALELWRGPALADAADATSVRALVPRPEERGLGAPEDRIEADPSAGRAPGRGARTAGTGPRGRRPPRMASSYEYEEAMREYAAGCRGRATGWAGGWSPESRLMAWFVGQNHKLPPCVPWKGLIAKGIRRTANAITPKDYERRPGRTTHRREHFRSRWTPAG
ncbi:BTAD domain-containing putative transcriptional regulator [Streptosporangium sp. NPDC000563]|uniref:BTAD domain-containing putative transcriptional regulator n=1 Tax=unclassified Streptosporangium TaxID=2632669 RepID=UPI0033270545